MPKRCLPALLLACALAALAPVAAAATATTGRVPASFAAAYQRGAAWAVGVYMFVPGEDEPRVGAGFFVDDKGSIATAAHLLGPAQQILIALPDRKLLAAEVLGRDEAADIALLRISPAPRLRPVLACTGCLRVGDWVMAIGEPFGLERSVSAGIVSGKDRHFSDDDALLFIQSDVGLNPGNSGGPLLDASGAIVGMNARTIVGPVGTPGASLAIPIDIVMQVIGELRPDGGAPPRPRLGAAFDDVPPLVAWSAGRHETRGALILSVPHGSLAEQLQLHAGDIVTTMNGRPIAGSADLVNALLAWRRLAGTRLVVRRAGEELMLGQE
ncbi:S1C family serine protease [Roseateles saccharophilus]|uniref:S1-C subfamily serine protease n=1 Tax=Roseateles saccharophilus TaxID=304 RepID=A0A4R3UIT9_ROSSA|nr:trypsin-like peptidase domain-containing protein [Roseateles saccharophilus]MDG0836101.1 PDZ domain-containing protein [Roseateles saccharophilus]TCU90662.1 S1-C subfamily serine protease [Roseateles saccharophilus]